MQPPEASRAPDRSPGVSKTGSAPHKSMREIFVAKFYKGRSWGSGGLRSFSKGNRAGKKRRWMVTWIFLIPKPVALNPTWRALSLAWWRSSWSARSPKPTLSGHVELKNFQGNRQRRRKSHSVTAQEASPNHHLVSWLLQHDMM